MARNVEIKARVDGIEALLPRARALAGSDAQRLLQDDTFFRVPHGRLKLREFGDGSAELIQYQRHDTGAARLSDYVRTPVPSPASMRDALERALGAIGRVRKQRLLLMVGAARIHLDRVQDLGEFIELEVVLRDDQSESDGVLLAEQLMHELGLAAAPRIACAYLDLLVAA
ncbi:MAG TPA: class IV adenylate cyclase [Burkholderiaceae bacterium]